MYRRPPLSPGLPTPRGDGDVFVVSDGCGEDG